MNEYSREIRAYRALEKPGKAHGKVFVKVLGVRSINVPIPRLPTWFTCTLNNGIHFVSTPECRLARDSPIEQEFELIEHNKLEFTLTLKVKKDPHVMEQAKRAPVRSPAPVPTPAPAPAPQKSSGGMRAFFGGSPKNSTAPPPPPPVAEETLIKYLRQDGTLARTFISFKDFASLCDTHLFEISLPLMGAGTAENKFGSTAGTGPSNGNPRVVGQIVLQMFRLPPLPGIPPESLPQSLEECLRGIRHTSWHKVTYHEGILTQNGGDCSTWRRRQFRVIGAQLVAFNDVTKKATATIELRKAISVEDDTGGLGANVTQVSINRRRTRDSYDAGTKVERSFRLVFPDDDEIEFFADTDEEKSKWLQVFRALLGRIPPNPLWAELVWQRQQDLAATGTALLVPETRAPSRQR
ncbi:hypothetical protein BS47DRAFT_1371285 [Hydnum rufescens UP504]|uniref:PH domain-containing protein n=1 Tax=Hydnum rufescens UP504 TaxID=1448309 RepID=A0A9P6B4S2_9AGAM|nr:hypothetical protein BS47DRAFT_1371285 [Hydnum rufescens UP504]